MPAATVRNAYSSCANRHCPKCQSLERVRWVEPRSADLLPTHYFTSSSLSRKRSPTSPPGHKRVVYGILFAATAETLISIASDPKRVGARINLLTVLHT
ncbi:MAG: transposase zinc-binding domain-containing protein [Blastocatellia bacterium]|nr:transposase zinc-binding domain-containing protein [Blastocatellia bacterium]